MTKISFRIFDERSNKILHYVSFYHTSCIFRESRETKNVDKYEILLLQLWLAKMTNFPISVCLPVVRHGTR